MNPQKKWFTLMEILIIIIIVSVGIVTVILALNGWNTYLQKSREKIIATNLAREWVEEIINIRNSNRRKNAGKKEETRLKTNPMSDDTTRFWSGIYVILVWNSDGQKYFYWSWVDFDFNPNWWLTNNNKLFSLCQYTGGREACPGNPPNSVEGKFFRRVRGLGLYEKNSLNTWWTAIICTDWSDCNTTNAKEFRFCVVVDYIGQKSIWKTELCSVLTNFKE